jgi:hypothetical protein
MFGRFGLAGCLLFITTGTARLDDKPRGKTKPAPVITWKKTVVDRAFRSEGVAVADVNQDGKMDIIVGDVWYEAPDWKMHVIRKGDKYQEKGYNPLGYSQTFAVFAEDINGDGWPDAIVIGFPGEPARWYENPGKKGGLWKEHIITHSACNETPLYADLFGTGKRVLVMGVQPKGQDNMGQMFWIAPGKDPTQPWEHHPISEPSTKEKVIPGTFRYAHGLGVSDVNGDGRLDVICTAGWWEQPRKQDGKPWKFHPANLGPDCANMFAFDMDGDGKNDIISSSAHQIGMWWHEQRGSKDNPTFARNEMFFAGAGLSSSIVSDPKNYLLQPEEKSLLDQINQLRAGKDLRPVRAIPLLCRLARGSAENKSPEELKKLGDAYRGKGTTVTFGTSGQLSPADLLKSWLKNKAADAFLGDWQEVGVGFVKGKNGTSCTVTLGKGNTPPTNGIVVWEGMKKQLVSQTHALHFVDINGDGIKDLVTGRRWWAHGPRGDALPTEPAFLFWFEGKKGSDGIMTFVPHVIDDDSGIGTQFAIADINGDGLLDIIVSNKKGVFIFEQVRGRAVESAPVRKE